MRKLSARANVRILPILHHRAQLRDCVCDDAISISGIFVTQVNNPLVSTKQLNNPFVLERIGFDRKREVRSGTSYCWKSCRRHFFTRSTISQFNKKSKNHALPTSYDAFRRLLGHMFPHDASEFLRCFVHCHLTIALTLI